MTETTRVPTAAEELAALLTDASDLTGRYRAYRERQARGLVRLLPREAIRPLYRRALRAAEAGDVDGAHDPLAVLVRYCEGLIPLPPFDVWVADAASNPDAHLDDLAESGNAPTPSSPATIEVRGFEFGGEPWLAHLRSFLDEGIWRGYIAFEDRGSGRVLHTALVFSEAAPTDLRERFLSFTPPTLGAFLRSALP